MLNAFAFLVAAFMLAVGVVMLFFLPKVTAIHAELQRAGKLTADEARQKRKNILAGGVLAIALGIVMALMAILHGLRTPH